jgi:hypothetical protein
LDFVGTKQHYVDSLTGEQGEAEVFIATLENSHDTYAVSVDSQQKGDLRDVSCITFEYWGGVPRALVPDNLNSDVTQADNHGPVVDWDLLDTANHHGPSFCPPTVPNHAIRPSWKGLSVWYTHENSLRCETCPFTVWNNSSRRWQDNWNNTMLNLFR